MSRPILNPRWRGFAVAAVAALLATACSEKSPTTEATSPANQNGEHAPVGAMPMPTPVRPQIFAGSLTQSYSNYINNAGGMGQYRYGYQDFGWQHTFSLWNTPGITITSAKLLVYAYDVDSNVSNGEFDALSVDGVRLNPGYLQGSNNAWTTTTFDVPVSALADGIVNVFLDIDINCGSCWATQIGSSELVVTYTIGPVNAAPYKPQISGAPNVVSDADDMTITVTGPTPADPDGDPVTYEYRWFVDTGNGGFQDPQTVGRSSVSGNVVPAATSMINDQWRVQVTARDDKGAISDYAEYTFPKVTRISDTTPPVVTANVTGTLGQNGWYTSDASITWSVSDAQSAITSQTGCSAVTVSQNTDGFTSTCTATSAGGSNTQSVTVKVDKTAPTITGSAAGTNGLNGWFTSDVAVSFDASDDISGVSSTSACAANLTTDTNSQTYDCTVTNGAGLSASASVTVKRDATAPTIQPNVSGPLGNNGWYVGDVSVSFSVADATSGVTSPACSSSVVSADTPSQSFSCSATDGAGNSNSASATVKRDATKPLVSFVGFVPSYTVDQTVGISCSISDALSGVAQQSCNGASGDAYTFTLGSHSVSASATDNAGNAQSIGASFTVNVTSASVCTLVRRWVSQAGLANSLCVKLDSRGKNQIGAFQNEVAAQSGKAIAADKAAILSQLAGALN